MRRTMALLAAALLIGPAASAVRAGTVTVFGTDNPWLAGMPDGSTALGGDVAPDQSPTEVLGLSIIPGDVLMFTATGLVNFEPPLEAGNEPDGNSGFVIGHTVGAENGLSDVIAPVNALLGVFLGPDRPDLTAAPDALDFSSSAAQDYLALSPLLQQVFFIGDGSTSGGVAQGVIVPVGATRLFLGTMDGSGWFNNVGSFEVDVRSVAAVPEPASLAMLALGTLCLLGYRRAAR